MKKKFICKKAKTLVPFLLFVMCSLVSNAQTAKITGSIFSNEGKPLPGATILVNELNLGTTSSFDGSFEFEIKKGNYSLKVSYVGYQSAEKNVSLEKNTSLNFRLETSENILDEVLVSGVRVKSDAPVTHSNLSKKEIAKRNLGQDIPILMNFLPSVVTTSDAGAGVGYTGIRVRGSDATRVNVTINGIPYNDSESMGTYWVNLGDFASSVEDLQLQRGVGTSTNGAGAFGASLNMLTDATSKKSYGEYATSAGSYNTSKNTLKFSTGKLNDHFELAGRVSKIKSDGYIDRASSDLNSYFFQASYIDENTLIKALVFGGAEETYQAWYGTPLVRINGDAAGVEKFIADNWLSGKDADNLRNSDRRYNYYTYDNEVDHYNQDHYQLHWNQKINEKWSSNIALHYTWGRGYYEQYKTGESFADYGLNPIVIDATTIDSTDLIRRKWLDNDFYGFTFSLDYKEEKKNFTLGGALNNYQGDHFGEIIWARNASQSEIRDRYYDNYGDKVDGNLYLKGNFELSKKLNAYIDVQQRYIRYKATGVADGKINKEYNFFNPKAGLTFALNPKNSFYASYARANREPNRGDFENGSPKPETLDDFELGWRFRNNFMKVNSNFYFMNYQNQLVLSGAIDGSTGEPLRTNVGESFRLGLEIDAEIRISKNWLVRPNIALSKNKNKDLFYKWDGALRNFGDTNIAFSPNIVGGNMLTYLPNDKFQITLLSKYVSEQFMANIDAQSSKLSSYFVNDLNASYVIKTNSVFKSITLTALVNNIFNELYISNGYYGTWDDDYSNPPSVTTNEYAGFYPQATRNFLLGATFKF